MASKRNISGKKPQFGQNRSKAMNATKRKFNLNLQQVQIYVPELNRTVRVRVTAKELKTIDKIGFKAFMDKRGLSISDLV
jgi:large subunit ribosomal protein L28